MRTSTIKAPEGVKYLSDVLPEKALPRNCIFNKVLTGCGGTYLALTDPEPYIIAVPTRSLVKDKVLSPQYKYLNVQGVSEDYPIGKRPLNLHDKIVVTYKSLPRVAKLVDIQSYNLLIDEMHMLSNMAGYAREELQWILDNFKDFKSYCFMSATIPRRDHLPSQIATLDYVKVVWQEASQVSFDCYLAKDVLPTVLAIMLQHQRGEREGTPYFFYNSVTGICNVAKKWRAVNGRGSSLNVICANTPSNLSKLRAAKLVLGSPNKKADFHFITATAFEGVDFYDPNGVTYIISDKNYLGTKYSIETTIPQIVGRIRDSAFNAKIVVIFNHHSVITDVSPKEFEEIMDAREAEAKATLEIYNTLKSQLPERPELHGSVVSQFRGVLDTPHLLVKGSQHEFEDLLIRPELDEKEFPEVEFYPHARTMYQQTYDLLRENQYVNGCSSVGGRPNTLMSIIGPAPSLAEKDALEFRTRSLTLKDICLQYEENPELCSYNHPDWFEIIDKVGVDVCKSKGYQKAKVKAIYQAMLKAGDADLIQRIHRAFFIGDVYSSKDIKEKLIALGAPNPTGSAISRWFEVKKTVKNGVSAYRILHRRDTFN